MHSLPVPEVHWGLLSIPMLLGFHGDSSFSTLRKKQRGPEGVSDFPSLTATPSGLSPPPHGAMCWSCLPAQRPRGGVPFPGLFFVCRCGAPLYGVAPLPERFRSPC